MVVKRSQAATKKIQAEKRIQQEKQCRLVMHKMSEIKSVKRITDTWDTRVLSRFIDIDIRHCLVCHFLLTSGNKHAKFL